MFGWIFKLFTWLTGLWGQLPDHVKERIINIIVESFEILFREFFRSKKSEAKG